MCVLEGWRMIGKRTGGPLRTFPERIGADTARDYESMDMPTALRPQALMAFRLSGEILPRKFGCPFKIRAPTKLGGPNFVTRVSVTSLRPRRFRSDRGNNWFSGI